MSGHWGRLEWKWCVAFFFAIQSSVRDFPSPIRLNFPVQLGHILSSWRWWLCAKSYGRSHDERSYLIFLIHLFLALWERKKLFKFNFSILKLAAHKLILGLMRWIHFCRQELRHFYSTWWLCDPGQPQWRRRPHCALQPWHQVCLLTGIFQWVDFSQVCWLFSFHFYYFLPAAKRYGPLRVWNLLAVVVKTFVNWST